VLSMSHLGLTAPLTSDGSLDAQSQDAKTSMARSLALRSPNEAYSAMFHLENRAAPSCTRLSGIISRVIRDTTAMYGRLLSPSYK
jgi:hypothetical protein